MCGIVGVLGKNWAEEDLRKARDAMYHRGPDDAGLELMEVGNGNRVGLGHRRLCILDLSSAGRQPMLDRQTGNWIVFNGEIYNHLELRRELPDRQYFSTSDTETLLAAYAQFGRDLVNRLVGMYAFAIWDGKRQELFLARDRLGKKPLYYCRRSGWFAFASEIKALLAGGYASRYVERLALESYLAFGAVQEPHTILKEVRMLAPGHWLRVGREGEILETRRYWALHQPFQEAESGCDPARVRSTFFQAVKERLISDVPIGAFLSGGIDSSAIIAAVCQTSGAQARTFCLDFQEGEYREGAFARSVAERWKTDHVNVIVTSQDLLKRLDLAFESMDQPTADGINSFFVSEVARSSGVTVALSGQGGDEIFAGYPSFSFLPRLLRITALPRCVLSPLAQGVLRLLGRSPRQQKLSAFFAGQELDIYSAYAHQRGVFWDSLRGGLLLEPSGVPGAEWLRQLVPPAELALDVVNQVSQLEIESYLRNMLLRDLDVFSMAHSLEVRAPMLDHRLVELMARTAGREKMGGNVNKHLLVSAMGQDLTQQTTHRRKGIFWFPWEQWLRTDLRAQADDVFGSSASFYEGLGLRKEAVLSFWHRFQQDDRQVFWLQPWTLLVLLRFAKIHQLSISS